MKTTTTTTVTKVTCDRCGVSIESAQNPNGFQQLSFLETRPIGLLGGAVGEDRRFVDWRDLCDPCLQLVNDFLGDHVQTVRKG